MASGTLMSVEEYLKTSFDAPEPDYLDGEIIERHLGSIPHFEAQERMLEFFRSLKQSHSVFAYPEVTLRMSPSRFRVADVSVFSARPTGRYPVDPIVVIEIVSEDDSHATILRKLAEYHAWGVKHVWSADPWVRKLFVYDDQGYHEVTVFELPEFGATITASELFAD